MNNELLINNIINLSGIKNEYPTRACAAAGVGKSFISNLKSGVIPSVEKVQMLAEYFGVTTSELLGENKKPPVSEDDGRSTPAGGVSEETRTAMDLLSRLNPENRYKALDYLEYQLAKQAEAEGKK